MSMNVSLDLLWHLKNHYIYIFITSQKILKKMICKTINYNNLESQVLTSYLTSFSHEVPTVCTVR